LPDDAIISLRLRTSVDAASLRQTTDVLKKFSNKVRASMLIKTPMEEQAIRQALHTADSLKDVARATVMVDNTQRRNVFTIAKWALGWKLAYGSINLVMGGVKSLINNMMELETQMAQIRIASSASTERIQEMRGAIRALSMQYGTASRDVARAAKIYVQQGLGLTESLKRTEIAMRGALITGQSIEEMVENLTAAQRGYNLSAAETAELLDKWVAVAMKAPVSTDVLAQSYRRLGAIAADVGVTVDQLNAMIAGLAGTMRLTGQQTATALSAIFMRLRRQQATAALRSVGIEPLTAEGTAFKTPYEILSQLAGKWEGLSGAQRRYLTEQLAGIRRGKELVGLLRSWDAVERSLAHSIHARGEALRAAGIAMDTTERQVRRLTESLLAAGAAFLEMAAAQAGFRPKAAAAEMSELAQIMRGFAEVKRKADEQRRKMLARLAPGDVTGIWRIQQMTMMELYQEYLKEKYGRAITAKDLARERVRINQERMAHGLPPLGAAAVPAPAPAGPPPTMAWQFQLWHERRVPTYSRKWLAELYGRVGLGPLTEPYADIYRELAGEKGRKKLELLQVPQTFDLFMRQFEIEKLMPLERSILGVRPGVATEREKLRVLRMQADETQRALENLRDMRDIGEENLGHQEAQARIQELMTKKEEILLQIKKQREIIERAIVEDQRRAADMYFGAVAGGFESWVTGQGTFEDIWTGLGGAIIKRSMAQLTDKMDKLFMGLAEGERPGLRFLGGALQGYVSSGGSALGAGVAGLVGMIPQWGPILAPFIGMLFRKRDDDEQIEERRYQNRVEWQNAVLEQLVLANRNLVGLREGGTFALPSSYYYRARTSETLAGELEMALRG